MSDRFFTLANDPNSEYRLSSHFFICKKCLQYDLNLQPLARWAGTLLGSYGTCMNYLFATRSCHAHPFEATPAVTFDKFPIQVPETPKFWSKSGKAFVWNLPMRFCSLLLQALFIIHKYVCTTSKLLECLH